METLIMTFEDCSNAIRQLSEVRIFDYFKKRSMPEFVEPLVTRLVDSFSACPEPPRLRLLSAVTPELSSILGWYARKSAGRAVRDRSREDLLRGLVALAISGGKGDFRDAMAPLALLYNSALRLQEDPTLLFDAASRISTPQVVQLFRSFVDRPAAQKSTSLFGFSEGTGPFGFDYVPLLPEYGGPTPF
ncbi:MAG: hypothetical protein QOK03_1337 [Candidatus Binataceae bacterium]|jgi:hypothetical protein|nr:hypothetical protein [Candidatus Binataceae bacterium]